MLFAARLEASDDGELSKATTRTVKAKLKNNEMKFSSNVDPIVVAASPGATAAGKSSPCLATPTRDCTLIKCHHARRIVAEILVIMQAKNGN